MYQRDETFTYAQLARTDFHLLSVFINVVEAGGFSAAQIRLNVGQSTISRQMADLEQRLGMKLCQRGRVGFRLTDKGRKVYQASLRLFSAVEGFRSEVGGIQGKIIGELSLAVVDNWVTDQRSPLTAALKELKEIGPAIHINLHTVAPDDIELAVLDNRVALGVGVFHRHRPGLTYELLYFDPMELFCAKGHPLFGTTAKSPPSDWSAYDLARRGYLVEEEVAPLTVGIPSSGTAHQMEGVAHLILTGLYVGYLPVSYAAPWVRDKVMHNLWPKRFGLKSKIEIVARKSAPQSQMQRTFIELLHKHSRARTEGTNVPSTAP